MRILLMPGDILFVFHDVESSTFFEALLHQFQTFCGQGSAYPSDYLEEEYSRMKSDRVKD